MDGYGWYAVTMKIGRKHRIEIDTVEEVIKSEWKKVPSWISIQKKVIHQGDRNKQGK